MIFVSQARSLGFFSGWRSFLFFIRQLPTVSLAVENLRILVGSCLEQDLDFPDDPGTQVEGQPQGDSSDEYMTIPRTAGRMPQS